MGIVQALRDEESKVEKQLIADWAAITALNGVDAQVPSSGRRTMSAAARARISRATKARWAKFRAEQAKKGK